MASILAIAFHCPACDAGAASACNFDIDIGASVELMVGQGPPYAGRSKRNPGHKPQH